ncbi:hypothetical protein RM533_06655 [Croceicoccus sp. F390]|uniref:Uncharacterized protein n=1 Tax=Croceicoccus esteveae TaxID=3075597 RepID=A0ABU2ZGY8_9SPHN|nr:hypothetical protein [Croceicoccus sp. F390]MDT0575862.1 hypothetical protein [Croceicoccus sp. F390]
MLARQMLVARGRYRQGRFIAIVENGAGVGSASFASSSFRSASFDRAALTGQL